MDAVDRRGGVTENGRRILRSIGSDILIDCIAWKQDGLFSRFGSGFEV